MPWRVPVQIIRQVVLEAETRPLEFGLATLSAGFGVWLLLAPPNTAPPEFWFTVNQHGGITLWATWALFNGVFQGASSIWRYPQLRRWSSSFGAAFWGFAGCIFMSANPWLLSGWTAAWAAAVEGFIAMRRSAIATGEKNREAQTGAALEKEGD